jgi:hypothetical protein
MVLLDQYGPRLHGLLRIKDGLEGLHIQGDPVDGPGKGFTILCHHKGHRIAPVSHPLVGQDRLVFPDHALAVGAFNVLVGEDRDHPRDGHRAFHMDGFDPSVGNACPFCTRPEQAVSVVVCRIQRTTRDLVRCILPGDGLSDLGDLRSKGAVHGFSVSKGFTASTHYEDFPN